MGILKNELLLQWRRQRWVPLAAAGTSILCFLVFYLAWPWPRDVNTDFRVLKFFLLILWSVAGASAGALIFAGDSADIGVGTPGKEPFGILLTGMLVALAALFLAGAILVLVPAAFALGGWDFLGRSSQFYVECVELDIPLLFGFLLPFGGGAYLSSRGGHPASCIISSTVVSVLLFVAVSFFWLGMDLYEFESAKTPWILSTFSISALLLLTMSIIVSVRRTRDRKTVHGVLRGALLIAGATLLACVFLAAGYALTGDGYMEPYYRSVSPTGREILLTAHSADGRKNEVWVLPADPGKGKRTVLRQAYDPVLSPDGSSILNREPMN